MQRKVFIKFAIKHILNLGLAYIHIAKENKNVIFSNW